MLSSPCKFTPDHHICSNLSHDEALLTTACLPAQISQKNTIQFPPFPPFRPSGLYPLPLYQKHTCEHHVGDKCNRLCVLILLGFLAALMSAEHAFPESFLFLVFFLFHKSVNVVFMISSLSISSSSELGP